MLLGSWGDGAWCDEEVIRNFSLYLLVRIELLIRRELFPTARLL